MEVGYIFTPVLNTRAEVNLPAVDVGFTVEVVLVSGVKVPLGANMHSVTRIFVPAEAPILATDVVVLCRLQRLNHAK